MRIGLVSPNSTTASTDDRKSVLVTLPRDMKARLVTVADLDDACLNDTMVSMLADRFGIEYEPKGVRGTRARRDTRRVVLRMPPLLKLRIQLEALHTQTDMGRVIVSALAAKLRMNVPPRRTSRATPFGGGYGRPRGLR